MEKLNKDFDMILAKYEYYDKIEPNLTFSECMQFEKLKEIIEKKNIFNLKVFINSIGYENIIRKLKSRISLSDDDLNLFSLRIVEILNS